MLKSAKRNSSADINLIERIARESRSETLARLQASAEGLSSQRAQQNRAEYGANIIRRQNKTSRWRLLFESIAVPFNLVLIVLTLLTLFTNYIMIPQDSEAMITVLIMVIMIVVSIGINFVQKVRVDQVKQNLSKMMPVTTNIRRDGEAQELPIEDVVVGDVINISAGDMIPADMRLLTSKDLFCSSTIFSGNSKPTEKVANFNLKPGRKENYLNYSNILYEGTTIVSGSGTGIVFAVGNHTLFGRRSQRMAERKTKQTPFEREIKKLAHLLLIIILILIPLLWLINGLTKGQWGESLLFALAAAIGLTPEMLPVIVNSNLTRGAIELARSGHRGIAVKQMNAIQSLGAADVVCIDKTGTLTQNNVVLERHYDLKMRETPRILKFSYLNAYYQTGMKDLIDKAIIDAAGDELNVNEIQRDYNKIDEIPFDYTRKRMSVVVVDNDEHHGQHLLVTKGAAEGMLAISSKVEVDGQTEELTTAWREKILKQIDDLSDDGLRVLLLGYKLNPAPIGEFSAKDEKDLTLIGYVAYLDPPKESAKNDLAQLKKDHLTVKIFTGDSEAVTRAVGLQVGLNVDTVYTGEQVGQANDQQLAKIVEECNIFVRLTPEMRVRIINALKNNGHIVGYMGDGIKDAAAMRVSDVSFSVNKAVDIAKESADIILPQKDLSLVRHSLLIGRQVSSNAMKYIKIILTTNFGSLISMLVASWLLPFIPLLPLQLLILDLLYSISCLTIPFDRVAPSYLSKPQNWTIKKWPKFVLHFGPIPAIIDFITMALLFYVICPAFTHCTYHQWPFIAMFYSGLFVESLWTKEMVIHNLRDERFPFIRQRTTAGVLLTTIIIGLIGTGLVYTSGHANLGFGKLPAVYLWLLILIEVVYILLTTLMKWIYLKKESF